MGRRKIKKSKENKNNNHKYLNKTFVELLNKCPDTSIELNFKYKVFFPLDDIKDLSADLSELLQEFLKVNYTFTIPLSLFYQNLSLYILQKMLSEQDITFYEWIKNIIIYGHTGIRELPIKEVLDMIFLDNSTGKFELQLPKVDYINSEYKNKNEYTTKELQNFFQQFELPLSVYSVRFQTFIDLLFKNYIEETEVFKQLLNWKDNLGIIYINQVNLYSIKKGKEIRESYYNYELYY